MFKTKASQCVVDYNWIENPNGQGGKIVDVMGPCTEIENDETGEKFIFPITRVIKDIDNFDDTKDEESTIGTEDEAWPYNLKPDKFHARMAEIRKFVEMLTTDDMIRIIECMPSNKDGTIRKATQSVLITGITIYQGEPGCWCNITSAELCMDYYGENEFRFVFKHDRDANTKKYMPIIDPDGNYNKVTFTPNSYLKLENLIPGRIYADAKDREFLYLGKVAYKLEAFDNMTDKNAIDRHNRDAYYQFPFTFIPINDKKRREIMAADSLEQWMLSTKSFSLKESFAMKFVSETGIGFEPDKVACKVSRYENCKDYDGCKYVLHTRYHVYNAPMKNCYLICEKTTRKYPNGYEDEVKEPVYTCKTEADAAAMIKDFKRCNPGHKYSKQAQPCYGDAIVLEGVGMTMPDITDYYSRNVHNVSSMDEFDAIYDIAQSERKRNDL